MALEEKTVVEQLLGAWNEMKHVIAQREEEKKTEGQERAETKATLERLSAAYDAAQDELKTLRARVVEMETRGLRPGQGHYSANDGRSAEMKAAFRKYASKGGEGLSEMERKSLFVADSQAGGYLVPDEIVGPIRERLVQISPFRTLLGADGQFTIGTDNAKVPIEQGVYSAYMADEMTDVSAETSSAQVGMEGVPVYPGIAKVVLSQDLVDDSAFDFESYVQRKVSQRFAKLQGQKFISGNGRTSPEGVLTNATVLANYVAGGDASTLTYAGLNTFIHELPTDYAQNAYLGMNRKTVGVIRGIVGSDGHPLWDPGAQASGDLPTWQGIRVVELPDMPDVAPNAYPIIYGDFGQAYAWVDRLQMSMARLTDSKYIEKQQVALLFRSRFGGQVVLAEALRVLKVATS